jgi:DNA processing protein
LIEHILQGGGALVSEYENERPMQKHFFAQRNRLISALGLGTLIIEARQRSGTLLTAHEALEQGRPLWVLPGHPMDPHCSGSLDLIRDGANPLYTAEELGEQFRSEVQGLSGRLFGPSEDLGEGRGIAH